MECIKANGESDEPFIRLVAIRYSFGHMEKKYVMKRIVQKKRRRMLLNSQKGVA
jgi:hypothetical protein